jgi:NAD(P)-dependent dehydrogenase (short-subunit alcohol dehydrogenase family)
MDPVTVAAVGGGSVVTIGLLKKFFNGGRNSFKPDLTDKIVVITGANTGLGFIAAKEMAQLNAKVIVFACRSEQRGRDAIEKIKKETKCDNLEFQALDLNDLTSVKNFAENFPYDRIDILLNNAGIMALPKRETTAQGFEKQFGVNHVGHFLLTKLLLNKVKASEQGRIVNLSSLAHETGKMNLEDLHHEKKYVPWEVYS